MCLSPKRLPLQIINNSVNYQKYSFPFQLLSFSLQLTLFTFNQFTFL